MVSDAPIFDTISDKVFELLSDRIFVAHNVNFDYSFVHELERAGLKWTAKTMYRKSCKKNKTWNGLYSLGRLCQSLGIDLINRAGGDADATAICFTRLLAWDTTKEMDVMIKKTSQDQRLPPNLPREDFEQLPENQVSIIFMMNLKVIYVGKAVNLKNRASHFVGHKITLQRQNFLIYMLSL
jgi:DNA polymerase-3 subunit epsilon